MSIRNFSLVVGLSMIVVFRSFSAEASTMIQEQPTVAGSRFGFSLARNGDTLLIGAPGYSGGIGNVYLYNLALGGSLTKIPGSSYSFGFSVAFVGNNILVGAPSDYSCGINAGATYLYDGNSLQLMRRFCSPRAQSTNDKFGHSVAPYGSDVLIGAPSHDIVDSNGVTLTDAGEVYLLNSSDGSLIQAFSDPDGGSGSQMGFFVGAFENKILVAAPGYSATWLIEGAGIDVLFDANGGLIYDFSDPDPTFQEFFGLTFLVDGSHIFIPGPYRDQGTSVGILYEWNGETKEILRSWTNPIPDFDPATDEYFGYAVDRDGDNLLVGTESHTINGGSGCIFDYTTGSLKRCIMLPNDQESGGFLHAPLLLYGEKVIMGSPLSDVGAGNAGIVYIYDESGFSIPTPTPTQSPTPSPSGDHFKCYKSRGDFSPVNVTLADQFETKLTTVRKIDNYCDTVDKNSEGVNDPAARLLCYKIKSVAGPLPFVKQNITAENQFGAQSFLMKKPLSLCVPSVDSGGSIAPDLDHFKCYKAKGSLAPRTVALQDSLESKNTLVIRPETFCAPVDKNSEGIPNPNAYLTCYRITDSQGQSPLEPRDVVINNQFGSQMLSLKRSRLLCVPSLLTSP